MLRFPRVESRSLPPRSPAQLPTSPADHDREGVSRVHDQAEEGTGPPVDVPRQRTPQAQVSRKLFSPPPHEDWVLAVQPGKVDKEEHVVALGGGGVWGQRKLREQAGERGKAV
ncbi:hypothetical protein F751_3690 [Auxenochlorella protothecoides]|uniref:Uncharacterized protein n=1 Tax=Auxenochlorella protothecoides TaxID=3075 RepID=A0A087STL9_AUXPR|nr:hypothetical protein F751_3690 [Auxenochlorella protothecoides]KFM29073.1 hypothetical protein F751_3690 [Auxenochlorella protothecoides]